MATENEQWTLKVGLAQMLKGGVIMDVVNAEQAVIAEKAGAVAVMALERVPADIRANGGVARMSDPKIIKAIKAAVSIPVMAKARIGHVVEAQILQQLDVDYVDESEVLSPADDSNHINKHRFTVPFVCGCRNLGEALRRIAEGAAMIRTKGEAGTGNVIEAVRHARQLHNDIQRLHAAVKSFQASDAVSPPSSSPYTLNDPLPWPQCPPDVYQFAKEHGCPVELVFKTALLGRLPVVCFSAGGVATPADAALMMSLGMDGVFVGSGIFKSANPAKRAHAIVQAVTHWQDPAVLAEVSEDLGEAMVGIGMDEWNSGGSSAHVKYAERGQ